MTQIHPMTSVPIVPLRTQPDGRWSVVGAVAFVAVIMAVSMLAAFLMQTWHGAWYASLDVSERLDVPSPGSAEVLVPIQLFAQMVQAVLIWSLAGIWHSDRRAALNLTPAGLSGQQWLAAVGILFAVKIGATMVAAGVVGPQVPRDAGPFTELVRSDRMWLLFLATVVMAGLTEELLFRGVLSRTLEGTVIGFWAGAGLASAAFALLHLQYGVDGQIVIFAVGMAFAWIRAWSGSVWPAVAVHALNNALALLIMRAMV
jgi:membrane protease YdiL (CAAX protease family)